MKDGSFFFFAEKDGSFNMIIGLKLGSYFNLNSCLI